MIILQRRVHEGVFKAEAEVVVNGREVEVQNQMTNFSSEDEEEFDNEAVIGHVLLTDSEVSDCMTCPVTPLFQNELRIEESNSTCTPAEICLKKLSHTSGKGKTIGFRGEYEGYE